MRRFLLPVFAVLLLYGCAPYEQVQDVIYLQNANIRSPLIQMPVFVATSDMDDRTLIVRPRFFLGDSKKYLGYTGNHSFVNEFGYFQYDSLDSGDFTETPGVNRYRYTGSNYQLQSTNLNFGFDADLFFSRTFGLSGGINFSSIDNLNLNGGHAGIILKNFENSTGLRFDAGVAWQQSEYDVQNVIVRTQKEWFGETERIVFFTRDNGIQTNWSFYLNLNLSYDNPNSLVGGFLNLGFIQQSILDLQPYEYDSEFHNDFYYGSYSQTDLRNEISTQFFSLNGGIIASILPKVKLMSGARYYYELTDEQLISPMVTPFIQLQFGI